MFYVWPLFVGYVRIKAIVKNTQKTNFTDKQITTKKLHRQTNYKLQQPQTTLQTTNYNNHKQRATYHRLQTATTTTSNKLQQRQQTSTTTNYNGKLQTTNNEPHIILFFQVKPQKYCFVLQCFIWQLVPSSQYKTTKLLWK